MNYPNSTAQNSIAVNVVLILDDAPQYKKFHCVYEITRYTVPQNDVTTYCSSSFSVAPKSDAYQWNILLMTTPPAVTSTS